MVPESQLTDDAASEEFFDVYRNWYGSTYGCRACPGHLYKIVFSEGREFEIGTDDPSNSYIAIKRLFTCAHCRRFITSAASEDEVANSQANAQLIGGTVASGTLGDPNNFEYQCGSQDEYVDLLQAADTVGTTTGRQDAGFVRLGARGSSRVANNAPGSTSNRNETSRAGGSESYQFFVERRLNERPKPTGDPMSAHYIVGAGEMLIDILLASANPNNSDFVLEKLDKDIAGGDSIAALAKELLNMWARKEASGDTASLEGQFPDSETPSVVQAYRMLILLYVAASDNDRISTLTAVLMVKAGQGHQLAAVLQVMLDAALRDLASLSDSAVPRATSNASTRSPWATEYTANASKSGCYVATAVYGTYDCPEVWVLRRWRDTYLATTASGRSFIRLYYRVSPLAVGALGDQAWFRWVIRRPLDRFVNRLRSYGYSSLPYSDHL